MAARSNKAKPQKLSKTTAKPVAKQVAKAAAKAAPATKVKAKSGKSLPAKATASSSAKPKTQTAKPAVPAPAKAVRKAAPLPGKAATPAKPANNKKSVTKLAAGKGKAEALPKTKAESLAKSKPAATAKPKAGGKAESKAAVKPAAALVVEVPTTRTPEPETRKRASANKTTAVAASKTAAKPVVSLPPPPVAPVRPQVIVNKHRSPAALRQILPPPPRPPVPKSEVRRPTSAQALRAFEHAMKIFHRRQFGEAKELFEQFQQRFPQEGELLGPVQQYLQVCNQKVGHGDAATPHQDSADELYDRGVYAFNVGNFSEACSFFEKALHLSPNEPHFLYSLAVTHAQRGAHQEALDYLRRSIQIQPRFRAQAFEDADLSMLRENRQFQELLGLTSPFDLLDARR